LVELLIVIAIVLILSSLAIPYFERLYLKNAVRAVVLTDLRNCISLIVSKANAEGIPPSEAVHECAKSEYTDRIELIQQNPIVLKAVGRLNVGELSCVYSEATGSISCDSTF